VAEIATRWNDIQLYGLRRLALDIYIYAREALYFPFTWSLLQLDIHIPLFLKDALILYGVPFAAIMANGRTLYARDRAGFSANSQAFEAMIRQSAAAVGKDPDDLWRRVSGGLRKPIYYYFRVVRSAAQWPLTYAKNFWGLFSGDRAARANAASNVLWISTFTILPLVLTVMFFAPEAIKVLLG
jgi:hypothetical protein